jgi:hypothetical protein
MKLCLVGNVQLQRRGVRTARLVEVTADVCCVLFTLPHRLPHPVPPAVARSFARPNCMALVDLIIYSLYF